MISWVSDRWDDLRGTFWFVPLGMVLAAGLASVLTLAADEAAEENGVSLSLAGTYARGPEGSRALLATVAGSMITIASVCFSITVVALQQASTQFGPRLLHTFMRDRGNQIVLGTFIAGFTYCLLVLRAVNGTDDGRFVPHLSVTVGLASAVAGVGVLIYFIHHAAASLQAEYVVAEVAADLHASIARLYPGRTGREPPRGEAHRPASEAATVTADADGYLQAVGGETLVRLAAERDCVVELLVRPGRFVIRGNPLARVWPATAADDVAAGVRAACRFGDRRSRQQDVEFTLDQLLEIALRTLSSGVNDSFTARACIDRLAAAICELAGRDFPSPQRADDGGRVRLIAATVTPAGLCDAAFHQLRQAGRADAAVLLHLLEALAAIGRQVQGSAFREPLLRHARLIHDEGQAGLPADSDRATVRERYQAVLMAFEVDG